MSLHKSKGLTSKVTVVVGFANGMIPFVKDGVSASEQVKSMQEQRRLFFVAMTRATEKLILSSAKLIRPAEASDMGLSLPYYGTHWTKTVPSPFATQLGGAAPDAAVDGDSWLVSLGIPA